MPRRHAPSPVNTLGAVMAAGHTTGFDDLRLALATAVLCCHSIDVSYGLDFASDFENGPFRPVMASLVPMFFALSGFLVAGSLDRCQSIVSFIGLRALRITPALAFLTLLAALILGPLLTRLPLHAYAGDPLLPRYFLNIFGEIQYVLPGLFERNPWARTVNAQLWTLPYEMMCYIALAALALVGIYRRRQAFALMVVAANLILAARYAIKAASTGWSPLPVLPGLPLVLAFLYGVILHLYRDDIRHSPRLGLAAGVLTAALLMHSAADYLVPLPIAYVTVWLGLMRLRPSLPVRHGDYSYGIFLFGFPIQQAVTQLMGPRFQEWYWNIAAALPLTILAAIISWHAVEKPALALRGPLRRLEARLLSASRTKAGVAAE